MNKRMSLYPASTFHFLLFFSCCLRLLRHTSVCTWRCQIHHQPRAVALCVKRCCGMFLWFWGETVSLRCPKAFGGLVKVKPVICLWRHRCAENRHPGSPHTQTHTTRQTKQMLYNHKPWHGTCPTEIPLWREREGAGMGAVAKRRNEGRECGKWGESKRKRKAELEYNNSVCLCASTWGRRTWEGKRKRGELQAVRAGGIDWLMKVLKLYTLHQTHKQMHMSASWPPSLSLPHTYYIFTYCISTPFLILLAATQHSPPCWLHFLNLKKKNL